MIQGFRQIAVLTVLSRILGVLPAAVTTGAAVYLAAARVLRIEMLSLLWDRRQAAHAQKSVPGGNQ